ncbi:hypothetical protein SAMN02990966_05876 [Rhodospirillales bacterium URHD0017]|nr:hypothetical protein SAMN02990966_05876 [Rhodospirillales bacterium URHD0017]
MNNNVTNNAYVYNGRANAAPGYGYAANPVATTAIVVGTAAVVGAAAANASAPAPVYAEPATVTAVAVLPCDAAPVNYNDISFYQCGSTWFTRAYVSGSVAYVVSSAPPGR